MRGMHPRQWLLPALLVIAASLVLGGLTSYGQTYLPFELTSFANSAGGWTILTFGLIGGARLRPLPAAVLGAVSFVLLVEGYRIVSGLRGYSYAEPFQDTWTIVGLVAGPVVGLSAALLRGTWTAWKPLAASPIVAVLVGEGIYGLTVVAQTTSPVYWVIEIVLGVALLVAAIVSARPRVVPSLLGALVAAAGAALYSGAMLWLAAASAGG